MQIHSNTDHKKEIKRPGRCGTHHESINPHGEILRILYQQYTTSTRKIKNGYPRDKGKYAR